MYDEQAMREFYAGVMAGLSSPKKEILPRRGQYQLIRLGVKAEPGQVILAKAPTATGKTIAALLMGVVLAGQGKRTVIATYTKILQDQYGGDLGRGRELTEDALDEQYIERMFPAVRFAVLKGAANYQCRVQAKIYVEYPMSYATKDGRAQIQALALSAGDPGEIPLGTDWTARRVIAADAATCGKHEATDCGYAAARAHALAAHVVITNHALVLVGGDFPDVFGPHDLLVIDECHNFPKAAESYGSEIREDALLKSLRAAGLPGAIGPVSELFARIPLVGMDRNQQWRYPTATDLAPLAEAYEELNHMARLSPPTWQIVEPLLMWVRAARQRIQEGSTANLERLPLIPRVEIKAEKKRTQIHLLGLLPVDIALVARRGLRTELSYTKGNPAERQYETHQRAILMMSATVGTPSKPSFVADRCGVVPDRVEALSSPLPYAEAMRVTRISKAAMKSVTWTEAVARLVRQTRGRSLVLMNSWARVMSLESELITSLPAGMNVYRQQRDNSRATAAQAELFEQDESSVLIGTASLFEGVNFPGRTLTQVVLVDMVMVPDVMGERLRRLGRRWDPEFRVPYVGMLLEQIFGRLIRAPQDVGLVVTLDEKFTTGWGAAAFSEALAAYGGRALEEDRRSALAWLRAAEARVLITA